MSKINIDRIVKDIRSRTTYLTPIIEAVCNSIDAIGEKSNGSIDIVIKRDSQQSIDSKEKTGNIIAVDIIDNGIGFTDENAESFDTYRSGYKINQGGKGFGRFMYLKYFNRVAIESIFYDNDKLKKREFTFGHQSEIIENQKISDIAEECDTGTTLHLSSIIDSQSPDKSIDVIARKLVERLLVIFATKGEAAPIITIREEDDSNAIVLNDYIKENADIQQIGDDRKLEIYSQDNRKYEFVVKVYKIFYSAITNKICLTADKREVSDVSLHNYVPEFKETMFDIDSDGIQKNFMIKAYVISNYLDENVTTERDTFNFDKEDDSILGLSEKTICKKVALLCKEIFTNEITERFNTKKQKIEDYVTLSAPWNKTLLSSIDIDDIPVGISDFDLEMLFQRKKFEKEQNSRIAIKEILERQENEIIDTSDDLEREIQEILVNISETQKTDLVHYVCQRKKILDLFKNLLRRMENGKAHKESEVHNVIFPMIKTDRQVEYDEHNLWLIDERFAFTQYVASDKVISKTETTEPDLAIIYKERLFYRNGENNILSPICIVEFKRPKRTEYSAEENPIIQACKYSRKILEGKMEMPDGLEPIKVSQSNTPVYIYIVCDITPKIVEFADGASLTISPDGEGYFGYMSNYHAYVEIMSFKKLLDDATMRNQIFFKKLGIV